MALDQDNLRINKILPEDQDAFNMSIPAKGSIYWSEAYQCIIIGNGEVTGGLRVAMTNNLSSSLADYLPLAGGTLRGNLTIPTDGKLYFGPNKYIYMA